MSGNDGQNAQPIVEVENLTKIFRDFWGRSQARAVNGINLTIQPGRVYGLLGPNGSGKSTTVKLILGLLYPTRGKIAVFNKSPRDVEVKRRIGYQPEETYLYPYLTASETLRFFGSLLGLSESECRKRTSQLLDMVGLPKIETRTVGEFSKGMARRLALAQALINDPDLVILDEPTAGLDPIACREIKDVLRVLVSRGKTIILCSHLLADVEDVCDYLTILYGGRIRAEGKVDDLLMIQEKTRIVAPSLTPQLMAEVSGLIGKNAEEDEITIDNPRMSLEQFFLEVVRRAQNEKQETSGAAASTGVAEFLEGTEGVASEYQKKVLEQLTGSSKADEMQEENPSKAEDKEDKNKKARLTNDRLNELKSEDEQFGKSDQGEGSTRKKNKTGLEEKEKQQSSEKLRNLLDPNEKQK